MSLIFTRTVWTFFNFAISAVRSFLFVSTMSLEVDKARPQKKDDAKIGLLNSHASIL